MRKLITLSFFFLLTAGCATGRDMTSENYLPEWENQLVYFPHPSETSGGQWAVKAGTMAAKGAAETVRVPLALAGNIALNAYYIPTWPLRRTIRGDKRLLVWQPLFQVGQSAGSHYFSQEWNQDLV